MWLIVVNSFKPLVEAQEVSFSLPRHWAWGNYGTVWHEGHVFRLFLNSLLVCSVTIVLVIFFASMAAWIFARANTRGIGAVYYYAISGLLFPASIIPLLKLLNSFHLQNGLKGLIATYVAAQMSITIFLITGFIKTIPYELEEAATVDGAGPFGIYFRIILPLLKPILFTSLVVLALGLWNEFFYALFILQDTPKFTLPLGLNAFANGYQYQTRWNLIFADVVLVSLPLVLLYVIAQRRIIAGLMGGAVKG